MECVDSVDQKTRILHLLPTSSFSGAENVACQIAQMLPPDAYEVAYSSPDGNVRQAVTQKGIQFLGLRKFSLREVRRIVQHFLPDVIHTHDVKAGIVAAAAAPRVRLISHIHVNSPAMRRVSLKSLAFTVSMARYDHVLWVAESAFADFRFRRLAARKSSTLVNVVDIATLERTAAQDPLDRPHDLCFIGRLTRQKNPERLMRVMRVIRDLRPHTSLVVIGTGELSEHTQEVAAQLRIEDMVEFTGYKANPLGTLEKAKLLVLTSRFEGTPMVALEALALGIPIVSTATDGMINLLDGTHAGVLADTVEGMAREIVRLLDDDSALSMYSEAARELGARMNDIESYRKHLEEIYGG